MNLARQSPFRSAAGALVALSLMLGCASAHAEPAQPSTGNDSSTIKIGFLSPLSGAAEVPGKTMLEGANFYLDQIKHTMSGHHVELVVENEEGNPATGMAKFKKLATDDKVCLIAGEYLSNVAMAIAPLAEKYQTPLVLTVAAADDLTQRARSPWVIRTGWCASLTQPFAEYALKKLHYKKVVTVAADYPFGWETAGDFQKVFEDCGGKVVQKLWLPLGFSDFATYIKKIRSDADAVFLCTVGPACTIVPKQYAEMDPKLPLFSAGVSFDDALLPEIGNYVRGSISVLPYSPALETATNKKFVRDYRAKFGSDPTQQAMHAYVCMMWINKAIDSLKGDVSDKNKVLAALKSVELKDSPKGPVKLDQYGCVIENMYVRKVENVNGHMQNTVIDEFPMVSQFWKYEPETYMKQPMASRDYPPCKYCQP
jgi:branched-chain amino acid transport system substrate-binding protein